MATPLSIFTAPDGTRLAPHERGAGPPLLCLPGGPMQSSAYLGDLGGLTAHRRLVLLDPRGTGASAVPADPASYRCDRQVADVEALREHLCLDRVDLLAHSAGANLALLYATRHPDRVARLLLITPSVYAAGVQVTAEDRLSAARLRRGEPWFEPAYEALESLTAGRPVTDAAQAVAPFYHSRWDDEARAYDAAGDRTRNPEAAAAYGAEGAFDPPATRAALPSLRSPVLLLAGRTDVAAPPSAMEEYAALFPKSEFRVQPDSGHFPWRDDPSAFTRVVEGFLGTSG
ncbi:alpha/beta fold hydrolase [Streptomyces sp. NPDC058417]|uniref:alpha/beta fold hydrolase n=1 Tax=unclassified Streptomyces TaxID=2593676 RepID=UPI003651C7DC